MKVVYFKMSASIHQSKSQILLYIFIYVSIIYFNLHQEISVKCSLLPRELK